MKSAWWLVVFLCSLQFAAAQPLGAYQHGTVVRMRMGDCLSTRHGFMVTMGGGGGVQTADTCPEYTLVSDRVVYVIVGKSSGQLIPLADVIDFRIVHADLAVRLDDSRHESKFSIKEMLLRSEWGSFCRST